MNTSRHAIFFPLRPGKRISLKTRWKPGNPGVETPVSLSKLVGGTRPPGIWILNNWIIPCGKRLQQTTGRSTSFLMGKSTINLWPFSMSQTVGLPEGITGTSVKNGCLLPSTDQAQLTQRFPVVYWRWSARDDDAGDEFLHVHHHLQPQYTRALTESCAASWICWICWMWGVEQLNITGYLINTHFYLGTS